MKFLLKYSYRNLWRSPKRTLIMVLSLALGSAYIIWVLNFANSGSKEIMNEFLTQYAGNYQIVHPDYYENDKRKFNNFKTINDDLIPDKTLFEKSCQRVTAPVFISGEKKTLGVLLTGIEVEKEKLLTTLPKAIQQGNFLSSSNSNQIVLGKRLAERIDIKIGDEVALIGQALDGSIANEIMQVVGLLDFGGGDFEETLAFTDINSLRIFLAMNPNSYHQRVSFDMKREIPESFPLAKIVKWTEILPEISVSIRFIDNFTWLVSIIVVLVISLGLANTILITFFEREKEFYALNIIGARSSWIGKSLFLEIFMMGTLSLGLGIILGLLATTYFSYHPINIQMFTGGKPIIMGGMQIQPLVKFYPVTKYFWQVPLLIYTFLALTMIYPLFRVMKRSKYAISAH
ncbi:MAG: ABC transporter permease [Bacteriovoracaceae bacterium]